MRWDIRVCTSFVTGAITATTVTIILLRVFPGTYVVLPCDPTITARPVVVDEYLDRFDLPPQQHLDLGSQQYHDLRALHIELGPSRHKDPGLQHHYPGTKHNDLGQSHGMGPWQMELGPIDLSHSEGKSKFSTLPEDLRLQLHQMLLREQQRKGTPGTRQLHPPQYQHHQQHQHQHQQSQYYRLLQKYHEIDEKNKLQHQSMQHQQHQEHNMQHQQQQHTMQHQNIQQEQMITSKYTEEGESRKTEIHQELNHPKEIQQHLQQQKQQLKNIQVQK